VSTADITESKHSHGQSAVPSAPELDTRAAAASHPSEEMTPQQSSLLVRWLRPGWPLFITLTVLLGLNQGLNQLIGLGSNPQRIATWKPFVWELSSVLVILALIPAIVRVERTFRLDSRPRSRIILAHTVGALVFSTVHTSGMVALRKIIYALAGESYDAGPVFFRWFYELQKDLITYLIILLGVFAVREFRVRRAGELHAAQLAADLSEARLRHLTAQVDPHFLFNALNTISNRMHEDLNAADRMIRHLGDLLRAAYATDQQLLVPLVSELDWLRSYAVMMAERFRGQLSFQLEVDPGLDTIAVPRLLLQPIVENAFRHGLAEGRGRLWVTVRRTGRRLCYTVSDDGVGLPDSPLGQGTGLSNISRRLQLLFPHDHALTFAPREPRGTVVTVAFPVSE
jgi:two-component system, LytTR family, sensor kinase